MKLATWMKAGQEAKEAKIGVLLDDQSILDLQPAAALYLREVEKEKRSSRLASELIPMDMCAFLARGEEALGLARRCVDFVQKKKSGG